MSRRPATNPFCIRCRLRVPVCICDESPRLRIATRVILAIHSIEWRRTSNTGHLARLALADAEIRIHGRRGEAIRDDVDGPTTLVLYPGMGAQPLEADIEGPVTLIIPDGNWNQARHMMRRVPLLKRSRPVFLSGSHDASLATRQNLRPEQRSTFAALASALGVLEGPAIENALTTFYREVIDRRGRS